MVFIQSQEYVDSYGKRSKNIIDLAGQSDYKMSLNPDTGLYDMGVVMGDYEKYLFTAQNEGDCTNIFRNILNHHGKHEATTLFDVQAFMIPEMEEESTLEDIEEVVDSVLEFFGYASLAEARRQKIEELIESEEGDYEGENITQSLTPTTHDPTTSITSPPQTDIPPITTHMVDYRHKHHYRHYM